MSATGIRAGRAFVEIGAHDKFTTVLKAAQARMRSFADGLKDVGQKLATSGLAMGAPIAASVMQFARFDDAMRSVGAVSRASDAELKSMTETAAELGRTTSFTSVEVANLMVELGRAGFSPRQINEMTEAVLNLSRATGTEAALSAGILAATLRQFKLEASDTARVADVLALAANSTFNTVEGLGESLKYAGPVANELGMSLEDTVAILGALGNVGIQGSEAGTALRRLGVIAAANGKDLKRIFNIDNVDADGKMKPLVQIMDEIGAALANLPVTEQTEKMNEAFGLLGITSASVLSGSANEVENLAESLKNAAGTAAEAAKKMDAGIGGSFRIILSAAEGVMNAVGKAVEAPLRSVVAVFTDLLTKITGWIGQNENAVAAAGAVAVALLGVGSSLIMVALGVKLAALAVSGALSIMALFSTASALAAGAIGALASPVGLVGAAIVGLGGYFLHTSGVAAGAIQWMQEKFGMLLTSASTAFSGIINAIKVGDWSGAMQIATAAIELAWLDLTQGLQGYWDTAMEVMVGGIELVKQAISSLGAIIESLTSKLQDMWQKATEAYNKYYNAVYDKTLDVMMRTFSDVETIGGPYVRQEGDNQLAKDFAADKQRLMGVAQEFQGAIADTFAAPKATSEREAATANRIAELRQLLADAASQKEPETSSTEPADLLKDAAERIASASAGVGDKIAGLTNTGTFSGFSAGRLSGESRTEQLQAQIAKTAEEQLEETKATRRAIENQQGSAVYVN